MDVASELFGNEGSIHAKYFDSILRALNIYDKYLGHVAQDEDAKEYGCFQYVSHNQKKFFINMYKAMRILDCLGSSEQTSFLDVGCGIGTKSFLASTLFTQADGVEFDKNYFNIAKKIHASSSIDYTKNIKFFENDALKFDSYGDYDVIHLYRPFHDSDKQSELEEKIVTDAKENALIIGVLCKFYSLPKDIRPSMVFVNGYLKTKDKELVEQVKLALRDTETFVKPNVMQKVDFQTIKQVYEHADKHRDGQRCLPGPTKVGCYYKSDLDYIYKGIKYCVENKIIDIEKPFFDAGAGDGRVMAIAAYLFGIPSYGLEYSQQVTEEGLLKVSKLEKRSLAKTVQLALAYGDFTADENYKKLGIEFESIRTFFNYDNNYLDIAKKINEQSPSGTVFLFMRITERVLSFDKLEFVTQINLSENNESKYNMCIYRKKQKSLLTATMISRSLTVNLVP